MNAPWTREDAPDLASERADRADHPRGWEARLHVLHVFQPADGGVPRVVEKMVIDQLAHGMQCSVAGPVTSEVETLVGNGAAFYDWIAKRSPSPSVIAELYRLRTIVKHSRPDVLHLHSAKAGLVGRLLSERPATVFQPHAWSFQASSHVTAIARTWEQFASRRTNLTICVSHDEAALGRESGIRSELVVIPNGVPLTYYTRGSQEAARKKLGLSNSPTILCAGRICHQKGQDLLLRAWPAVLAEHPNARLLMVGDGPARAHIASSAPPEIEPTIEWVGAVPDIRNFLQAADVVVMPSRWEGMALVPLEAMASGRVVVGFDVGGVAETVGEFGFTVRPLDVEGLAEALVKALRLPNRQLWEDGARSRAARDFDLENSLNLVRLRYKSLINGRSIK